MTDNQDLIGQTFRNGPDGVIRYTVMEVDPDDAKFVLYRNNTTGNEGWAIAAFVRLAIDDEKKERAA